MPPYLWALAEQLTHFSQTVYGRYDGIPLPGLCCTKTVISMLGALSTMLSHSKRNQLPCWKTLYKKPIWQETKVTMQHHWGLKPCHQPLQWSWKWVLLQLRLRWWQPGQPPDPSLMRDRELSDLINTWPGETVASWMFLCFIHWVSV